MQRRHYPLQALLRQPIELWSAALSLLMVVFLLVTRPDSILPPAIHISSIVSLILLFVYRLAQGIFVLSYRYGLVHSLPYLVDFGRIHHKPGLLFLGNGFEWSHRHAQRLADTERPETRKYVKHRYKLLPNLLAKLSQKERSTQMNPQSGLHQVHGVELFKKKVWMNLADRVGHTLVLGTTRVGKTRLAELLIAQDIQRGETVLVFDPKGDIKLLQRVYTEAKRVGREQDFYIFHLGYPEVSCRYNAIGRFSRITEVATRIANQLPGSGSSSAFKEFAWRFVNIIARALYALRRIPDYQQIRRYINDIEPLFVEYARNYLMRHAPAGWAEEVKKLTKTPHDKNHATALKGREPQSIALYKYINDQEFDDPILEGLMSAFKYDRTYFDKIVSSVGPLMEKLTTGPVADLIAASSLNNDIRPEMSWLDVIRRKGIVYVGLDALSDSTVASAVGNSMFADLVSVAGYLYKFGILGEGKSFVDPPNICIHADEFNESIGDEFIPLLNKAGGAGFQVTAYTQTVSDLEARVGTKAKSGQILGNFNSLIMLRIRELATAEILTKQLPKTELRRLNPSTGASDASRDGMSLRFKARNDDQVAVRDTPLLEPATLLALPRGHAFVLINGSSLWKVRIPLAKPELASRTTTTTALFDSLRARYEEDAQIPIKVLND
ncbi:MAG: type IV conjugative transfer system coupling protein TraD [Gammaproteobacteria bacterium]|nr:type IV conjugative transfer system coupling protein TraD [Gammaproteobacteria bacterium]